MRQKEEHLLVCTKPTSVSLCLSNSVVGAIGCWKSRVVSIEAAAATNQSGSPVGREEQFNRRVMIVAIVARLLRAPQ